MKLPKEWFVAALIRAVKTFCQTAAGFITIGVALSEINWKYLLSVSAVAAIYSILTSVVTGLPEVSSDGTLVISEDTSKWEFKVDTPLDQIENASSIRLSVQNNSKKE